MEGWVALTITRKLIALVAVPLLFTGGFAAWALVTTGQEAAAANRLARLVVVAGQAATVAERLQAERVAATAFLIGESPFERLQEYEGQTAATVAAVGAFRDAAGEVSSVPAGIADLLARIDGQIDRLGPLRADVRESPVVALSAVTFAYRTLIADLVVLREAVAQAGGAPADLASHIAAAAALSRATEFAAQQQVDVLRAVGTNGPPTPANRQAIQANRAGQGEAMASFGQQAPVAWRDWLDHAMTGTEVLTAQRLEDTIGRTVDDALTVDRAAWVGSTSARIGRLHEVEHRVDGSVRASVDQLYASKIRWVLAETAVVLIALMAAVLLAVQQSRAMIRRLRTLSDAARSAAFVSLPRTVEALRAFGNRTVDVEAFAAQAEPPLREGVADEIADVGNAFLAVHRQALRTAADLANMRAGMSQIFVHLARRNQRLVGVLIRELDTAERDEADPDRLATLFRLDQLATRMGRYTDNLLVVGGQTAARPTQAGEVPLATALQGAQSKIENYRQIRIAPTGGRIRLRGDAVQDLMNLLAELMDNATQFSPPNADVAVETGFVEPGRRLVIRIVDQGVGMPPARIEQLNQTLADPPSIDVTAIRSMGLTVVAHIAVRYGVQVALRPAPLTGVAAEVHLPPDLWRMEGTGRPELVHSGPPPRPRARPVPLTLPAAEPEPPIYRDVASHFRGYFVPSIGAGADYPVPDRQWRGVADPGWAAAAAAATPTVTGQTRAGLPRRDPYAHLIPGAVPDGGRQPGAVDYRDPAQVAAAVSAFAHGNAYSRSLHTPNP